MPAAQTSAFKNAWDRAIKGTLDDKFRKQMVDDIKMSAQQARAQADAYDKKTSSALDDEIMNLVK